MSAPNYGTSSLPASASISGRNGITTQTDVEQPLLPKPESQSFLPRMLKKLRAEVSRDWADLVLLLCYVVTGLLDSSSIQAWGSFVSMQTGTFNHETNAANCAKMDLKKKFERTILNTDSTMSRKHRLRRPRSGLAHLPACLSPSLAFWHLPAVVLPRIVLVRTISPLLLP